MQDPGTRLWLPPPGLAGCLRAAMLRNTRGRVLLPEQRHNCFPAAALVGLAWCLHGEGQWLARPGFSAPTAGFTLQPLMVSGPFTQPSLTCNPGPVQLLLLLFLPDAFQALTGVDVSALVNRTVPAQGLLPPDWCAWAEGLLPEMADDARLARIEAFVQPRWTALAAERPAARRYADWMQGLALRAATSAQGRSLRQIERRVKGWAGLPMRELRAVSRAEQAFFAFAEATQLAGAADTARAAQPADATVNWADVAAGAAYADQSHLCRETRRITGFSPEDLRRRIHTEEAFWPYRLWR